jgi:hypothetical protein
MRQRHAGYLGVEIAVTCIDSLRLLVGVSSVADVSWRAYWTLVQRITSRDAVDCVEYRQDVERFFQMGDRRRLFDPRAGRRVVVGRDEDDRHGEALVELEATRPAHVNVEDETVCATDREPFEELARGRELRRRRQRSR